MRYAFRTVLLLTTLALVAPAALAFHRDDDPVASGTVTGAGWVTGVANAQDQPVDIEVFVGGHGLFGGALVIYFGNSPAGMLTLAAVPGHDGVLVDATLPDGATFRHDATTSSDFPGFVGGAFTLAPHTGPVGFALFGAGAVDSFDWAVRDAASVGSVESGAGTLLATSHDFDGQAHLSAYAAGVGGRANVDTSLGFSAANGFTGIYYSPFYTSQNVMSVAKPGGSSPCTCVLWGNDGAGDYSFDLTGAGAGLSILTDVIVIGADTGIPG